MERYNGKPIWHSPSAVRVVYSDTSHTGFGVYVVEHGRCVTHGQWTALEVKQSSTWRELSAVYLVLLSVANKLVNACVRWFTDNQKERCVDFAGGEHEASFTGDCTEDVFSGNSIPDILGAGVGSKGTQ